MDSKPLVLLSGGHTTQSTWAPLAERFDLCFAFPQAESTARELGVTNIHEIGRYLTGDIKETAQNAATLLSSRMVHGLPELSKRLDAVYDKHGPAALNGKVGEWWPGFFHHMANQQVEMISVLDKLFADRQPVACVVHEDVTFQGRVLVAFCRARGVPTLHIPHAPCHLLPGIPDIHRETRADFIAASGEYVADWYAASGFPRERIRVTGGPQWDHLYANPQPSRENARAMLAIENSNVICYATSWPQTTSLRSGFEREQEEDLRAVFQLANERKAVLLISTHYGEGPQAEQVYADALAQTGLSGAVSRNHMETFFLASDLVICQGPSNRCIDAAILGVPSCYIQTEGFDFQNPLPPRGPASTIGEWAKPADGDWSEFVSFYNDAHPGGDACDRVADLVAEISQVKA